VKKLGNQKGLTLIEVIIALAVFAAIAVSVFVALVVSTRTTASVNENTNAESLTRSALEIVKQCGYDATNNPPRYQECLETMNIPNGYDVVVTAVRLDPEVDGTENDDGIQKVTVEVKHDGELKVTTESYKVNR
jgi:prepilin-type N-terminal cleavage/methylation domain-containing protein